MYLTVTLVHDRLDLNLFASHDANVVVKSEVGVKLEGVLVLWQVLRSEEWSLLLRIRRFTEGRLVCAFGMRRCVASLVRNWECTKWKSKTVASGGSWMRSDATEEETVGG